VRILNNKTNSTESRGTRAMAAPLLRQAARRLTRAHSTLSHHAGVPVAAVLSPAPWMAWNSPEVPPVTIVPSGIPLDWHMPPSLVPMGEDAIVVPLGDGT
jgi:hypothetical protein